MVNVWRCAGVWRQLFEAGRSKTVYNTSWRGGLTPQCYQTRAWSHPYLSSPPPRIHLAPLGWRTRVPPDTLSWYSGGGLKWCVCLEIMVGEIK